MRAFWSDLISNLKKTYQYRYVILSYIQINLRLRYRRSVLGFIWTILAPLLQYVIVGVVFWYASKVTTPNYFAYFFTGAVVFNVFSMVLNRAPTIMLSNEHFIKKIYLPKIIYVLNAVLYEIVNFIFSALSLILLGLISGQFQFSWALLSVPFALILVIPALIGLSSFLGVAGVYFRDLNYIAPPVMQAFFFITPIAFAPNILPARFQTLLNLNPFYHFVEVIRVPVVDGTLASLHHWVFCIVFALVSMVFGFLIIYKFDNRLVFKL